MASRYLFRRLLNPRFSAKASSHSRVLEYRIPIFDFNLESLSRFLIPPSQISGARNLSGRSFPGLNSGDRGSGRSVQPKSLIEDEADLSDWVSELNTDSFRLGLTSDSEDSDRDRRRSSRRTSNRSKNDEFGDFDRSPPKNRRGSVPRNTVSRKRFGSHSEDFPSERRRGGKNSMDSFSRKRFDSDSDDFSLENKRGGKHSRGFAPKRRFDSDSDDFSSESRRLTRNSRSSTSKKRFVSDSNADEDEDEDEDENVAFSPRRRSKDGNLKLGKRGGKDSGMSYGNQGGVGLQKAEKEPVKRPLWFSDDEDEGIDSNDDDDDDESEILGFENSKGDVGMDMFESVSPMPKSKLEDGIKKSEKSSTGSSASYLSETRFDQCSISPLSLKGVKAAGYECMTVVQEATLPVILRGKDVLAKAKTGTGKTVAFLLPAIEVVAKLPPPDRDQKRTPINVLIICPTRELANQAAIEAGKLLKFHPSIGVQVVMGGTRLALEQKRMQTNPCQLLVATPGRLRDHIENSPGFATRLMGVKVLVLDEADHLLDMGFRRDIEKIVAAVPKQRQTLLFSATVAEEVRQICHIALKRDHEFINTVEEGSEETHSQVKQMHLVTPLDKQFTTLYAILKEHIHEDPDYKVLVFCTTAMVTKLVADLLSELSLNIREIHSRKPQSYRTRVSDEFRKSKGLILVTSDVSARGVDYPDVTLVVQMGVPADREQYIHRLGRTGRKGKDGKGILLLAPWEEFFLSSIRDLPIEKASLPSTEPDARKKVERALLQVDMKNKQAAYQAWLGYYNSNKNVGRDKWRLVELANEFSRSMGLDNPPAIPKLVLNKMGLRNIPGLRSR